MSQKLHFPHYLTGKKKNNTLYFVLLLVLFLWGFFIYHNKTQQKQFPIWNIQSSDSEIKDFMLISNTFILNETQSFWQKRITNLTINLITNNSKASTFYTNYSNKCILTITASNQWFKNYENDKTNKFKLIGNISECYLGQKFNQPPKWANFDSLQKEQADLLFNKYNDRYVKSCNNLDCESSELLVQDIYKKMIRDGFSAYWWLKTQDDINLINKLYEKHFFEFLKNTNTYNHPSHFVLKEILSNYKSLNDNNIFQSIDKAMYAYLQEMEFHYDRKK